jgi:hypothetical protein
MIDFSHLSKTEFEELCYDIIVAKGFTNVNWRKGTGKPSSPSDNGRDIEADKITTDNIDNSTTLLKYFFEVKHYKEGVPSEKIAAALTGAEIERPYCLIIIASNFLSNPCKNDIEKFIEKSKPKFQIRIWENKLLEGFLASQKDICLHYKLTIQGIKYRDINTFHLEYVTKAHLNKTDYLFSILDNYDIDIRDKLLEMIYDNYSISLSLGKKERYERLKEYTKKNKNFYKDPLFVHQIISEILAWAYHFGDIADKDNVKDRLLSLKKSVEKDKGPEDSFAISLTNNINSLDERYLKCNKYYNDFCDNVVFDLLSEPSITSIKDIFK